MTLEILKDLLQKNKGNTQAEQNLLRMFFLLTGKEFTTVDAALNA